MRNFKIKITSQNSVNLRLKIEKIEIEKKIVFDIIFDF